MGTPNEVIGFPIHFPDGATVFNSRNRTESGVCGKHKYHFVFNLQKKGEGKTKPKRVEDLN